MPPPPRCSPGDRGFEVYAGFRLVAPPLLWSEVRSALHQIAWRGDLDRDEVEAAHELLAHAPITSEAPGALGPTAWTIADEHGWAKTYDAEYLALGRLLDCRVATVERRLHQRVANPALVIGPTEL